MKEMTLREMVTAEVLPILLQRSGISETGVLEAKAAKEIKEKVRLYASAFSNKTADTRDCYAAKAAGYLIQLKCIVDRTPEHIKKRLGELAYQIADAVK